MNGNCHLINGLAVSSMVALNLPLITPYLPAPIDNKSAAVTLLIMGGLIGSVFPDIDNPTSNVGQLSRPFSTIIDRFQTIIGKTGSHHRGIFHDLFLYYVGLILSLILFPYISGFFLGCLSHVFLDAFNPSGIPLIFGIGKFKLAKIPSGSAMAVRVSYLFSILIFECGYSIYLYSQNLIR